MRSYAQTAIEWLMSHAWVLIVVLSVGVALSYTGVFDVAARPRFEGLAASSVQPISDEVRMYSDGILVFTVLNTKPYNIHVEWVEVSPLANRDDTQRTLVDIIIGQGDIAILEVNASNVYSTAAASVLLPSSASATDLVNFVICFREGYWGGAQVYKTHCGTAKNIPLIPAPLAPSCPEACCFPVEVYGYMCPNPSSPLPNCYECVTFDASGTGFSPWNACVDLCVEASEGECVGPYPGECSTGDEPPPEPPP